MKPISAELLEFLNTTDQINKADLYTITLADGTVVRTTSADIDLTWGGQTYKSCSPTVDRTRVRQVLGVEVDSLKISIKPDPGMLINGLRYQTAVRLGFMDGAHVLVETAYLQTWPVIIGVIHTFFGMVAEIEQGSTVINCTVKSALDLLTSPFPRNVYQSPCSRVVYSSGCGANRASFTFTGAVTGDVSLQGFSSAMAQASGYFELGTLTFTSGPNETIKRTVKRFQSGAFTFPHPLPYLPEVGDTFSVFAGCDRTKSTCQTKFNNVGRFKGYPWIPNPETAH